MSVTFVSGSNSRKRVLLTLGLDLQPMIITNSPLRRYVNPSASFVDPYSKTESLLMAENRTYRRLTCLFSVLSSLMYAFITEKGFRQLLDWTCNP